LNDEGLEKRASATNKYQGKQSYEKKSERIQRATKESQVFTKPAAHKDETPFAPDGPVERNIRAVTGMGDPLDLAVGCGQDDLP
jgi:hypothetical protein